MFKLYPMKLLKLTHPVHGVCAQEVITGDKSYGHVERQWKARYGRKFYECKLELECSGKDIGLGLAFKSRVGKPIRNVLTGEVYPNVDVASRDLGLSKTSIYDHCNRRLLGTIKYLVSWA